MMSQQDIQDAIIHILRRDCGVTHENIGPEARLQEDLGLDSMGLLNLALEVENHFQIYLEEAADNREALRAEGERGLALARTQFDQSKLADQFVNWLEGVLPQ